LKQTPEQQRVLHDISRFGCHAIHVQAAGAQPAYTYTVGIHRTQQLPDLVVFGQPHPKAHRLLHGYNLRLRRGERFVEGQMAGGFLVLQDVALRPVHRSHHAHYFSWNLWLHDGVDFPMLQLVYPTREGVWPWDAMAGDWFRQLQPLLDQPAA
jgi:hypothetical protein